MLKTKKRKIPKTLKCGGRYIPDSMDLTTTCELQAADAPGNKTGKPRLDILLNTGRPMKVNGFDYPVIVDIKGSKFDKPKTPIIMDHDTDRRLGYTTSQAIDTENFSISAQGVVSSKTQYAQDYVADAKEGFPFQSSMGATILKAQFVEEGDSIRLNGKEWKGPLINASRTLIRELTVTVLGADKDTSTKIAAKLKTSKERTDHMDYEEFVASLGLELSEMSDDQKKKTKATWKTMQSLELSEDDEDEDEDSNVMTKKKIKTKLKAKVKKSKTLRASDPDDEDEEDDDSENLTLTARMKAADEEERIDSIRQLHARYADDLDSDVKFKVGKKEFDLKSLKAHAVRDGWTADAFELLLMRSARPEVRTNPGIHSLNKDISGEALQCSLLRANGIPDSAKNLMTKREFGLDSMFDEKTLEASHKKHYDIGNSIQNLYDLQIRAAGNHFTGTNRRSSDFLALAVKSHQAVLAQSELKASGFSTLNITNVLENVMHKTAQSAFESQEALWRFICARRPVNDFKPHAYYHLDLTGTYRKVAPDGTLKHVSMLDSKKTITAETYGAMITIDRKTMRNDDLGVVLAQARGLGLLGAARIEESVFVLLLSNPSSFFAAGNGNLITGATSVLGLTALETARQSFRNQVFNGKPIGISPRILLTGTTNETLAKQLYKDETVTVTTTADLETFASNPNQGLYQPYVTPWLNNTSITDQDGNTITGQSSTQWYLFADPNAPQGAALNIAFLDGRETPYFDEAETQFDVPGGMQFRSYFDWGVAMHMTQMALKSNGA